VFEKLVYFDRMKCSSLKFRALEAAAKYGDTVFEAKVIMGLLNVTPF
jgi:hypothetical protein